jgi:osmotically-inducible protein OsmY
LSWVVRAPDRPLERAEKKTYTRVRRVLWDYEPLRASHAEIFIDVQGNQVRLRGRVRTQPQKLIASGIVARMPEVGEVVNELISDPEVVRAVADALAQDERTAAYVLRVDARHGVVTLRGEVASQAVQDAAMAIASSVPLVATVRNQTTIGGEPRPAVALPRPASLALAAEVEAESVNTDAASAEVASGA